MLDSSLVLKSKVAPPPSRRINLDIAVSLPVRMTPPNMSEKKYHGIAVVDTGASMSLVCKEILENLNGLPQRLVKIIGINGCEEETQTFLVDLHFVHNEQISWTITGIEVAPLNNSSSLQVLLGMDVLAKHVKQFTLIRDEAELHF